MIDNNRQWGFAVGGVLEELEQSCRCAHGIEIAVVANHPQVAVIVVISIIIVHQVSCGSWLGNRIHAKVFIYLIHPEPRTSVGVSVIVIRGETVSDLVHGVEQVKEWGDAVWNYNWSLIL